MNEYFKKTLKKLASIPRTGLHFIQNTIKKNEYKEKLIWKEISFHKEDISFIRNELTRNQSPTVFTSFDRELVKEIQNKTALYNRNNVTRTNAYLDFYLKHPEVHWALLAHLVSRNGGWNMTDLKGSILEKVLSKSAREDMFSFLELANAAIFQDAFSQLLLYEASKERNKSLFYILPKLVVSRFMKPVWERFFSNQHSKFLTVSLIINEQNLIEKPVIQNPYFKENVLDTLLFKIQELFQFTYVLFPYTACNNETQLAGITVSNFSSVHERVEIGKKLYAMLFGIENLHDRIFSFAKNIDHTASRNDYWPNVFSSNKKAKLSSINLSCFRKKPIIYSPSLLHSWPDVEHNFQNNDDWYHDQIPLDTFYTKIVTPASFDLTGQYCDDLQKLLIASTAIDLI